jgi:hypothetical protein
MSVDKSSTNNGDSEKQLSNGDAVTPTEDKLQTTQASTNLIAQLKEAMKAMGIDVADDSPILQDVDAMSKVLSLLIEQMAGASKNISDPSQISPNEQATVIAMSTETKTEVTPPVDSEKVIQMSAALVTQKGIIDQLLVEATNSRKQGYLSRIDALVRSGRCKKDKADAFRTEVGTYQFSVGATGQSALDMKLELLEELPEGAVLSAHEKIAQFSINETAVSGTSQFFTGAEEVSDERVNQILNEMYPSTPRN